MKLPVYKGQLVIGLSRLEASALRYAIELAMTVRAFGDPLLSYRRDRDAMRRIDRKLKRLGITA